ncbi:MAG TPA: 16S rRNA (cytosine(1402)-N(4))-methyltransferase RsmH, partial [Candidatus Paceibacterota bacterium]|nr:16S rRNA (cytosine(1402)-N(4))-methyltransferase RsmH [Candidatus Paceibacterota bacterium]
AFERAHKTLDPQKGNVVYVETNFRDLKSAVLNTGVKFVNRFIFDLGLSSDQLERSGRGFSFMRDEPLLMTFAKHPSKDALTAKDVVNGFSQENLAAIIKGFGEEQFSGRIARVIVEAREKKPIETSRELAEIVKSAVPARFRNGKIHPATKTFQAIRMAVNAELETLESALKDAFEILAVGGRISVITFHSGEDRVVKKLFKYLKDEGKAKLVVKKPIVPSKEEVKENPRARSAKLRVIEKVRE